MLKGSLYLKVLKEREKEIKEGGVSGVLGVKCLLKGMNRVEEVKELLEHSVEYLSEVGSTLLVSVDLHWLQLAAECL